MSNGKRAKRSPLRKKLLKFKSLLAKSRNRLKKNLSLKVNLSWLGGALKSITAVVLLGCSILLLSSRAPELHDAYIRSSVGSRVYEIKADMHGGGGTGFQIQAPSGTNYVMTNSHICDYISKMDAPENAGTALVIDNEGNWVRRHIVAVSDQSDLCLIEGMPGVNGLSIASDEPNIGAHLTTVGHPHLRPLTLSAGEVIGSETVQIMEYVMNIKDNPLASLLIEVNPNGQCNFPKNKIVVVPIPEGSGGGEITICTVITKDAYVTSMVIYPGNSGSPVVDFWGRVVGVMFASNEQDNYGDAVSLDDIQTFIARY